MSKRYGELLEKTKRIVNLGQASAVLGWDQEVMMPEKGGKPRAEQKSVISGLIHGLVTKDELADLIEEVEDEVLEDDQKAVLREIKRRVERERKVDPELVEEISGQTSKAVESWRKATKNEDFDEFKEDLRKKHRVEKKIRGTDRSG